MEHRRRGGSPVLLLLLLAWLAVTARGQTAQPSAAASGGALAAAAPLFGLTRGFVDLVYKSGDNSAILGEVLSINWSQSISSSDAWELIKVIIGAYSGFAACVIVGLLFIVLVPLTGLICCCCRCCGKCGGDTPIEDPPNAKAKRLCCSALVFVFTTLALGGAIGVFLSNQAIVNALRAKDGVLDHAQADLNGLVNVVNFTAEELLAVPSIRLAKAQTRVLSALDDAGPKIVDAVFNRTSASDLLQSANDILRDIPALNSTLVSTLDNFNELKSLYASLIGRLSHVKDNLTAECNSRGGNASSCSSLTRSLAAPPNDSLAWMQVVAPAVSEIILELPKLNSLTNITAEITRANQSAILEIQKKVTDAEQFTSDKFTSASNAIVQFTSSYRTSFSRVLGFLPTLNSPDVKNNAVKYSDYVRYTGIAIGSFFVLLVLLNYLGLCFGVCGSRPGFEASSCNKGIGARLLLAVFGLYVLLSWLLMVLTTILFLVSTAKIVCLAVDEPESRIPQDRLLQMHFGQLSLNLSDITEAFIACKNNKSVYAAGLSKVVALDSVLSSTREQINSTTLGHAISGISFDDAKIDFAPDYANSSLQQMNDFMNYLANATAENRLKQFMDQLGESNLTQVAQQIAPEYPSQAYELKLIIAQVIDNMVNVSTHLNSSLGDLQRQQSIVGRLRNLTYLVANFRDRINVTAVIQEAISEVADRIMSIIDQEIDELQNEIKNGSSCLPIYQQVQSMANVACTEALNPLSGMWFCVGWCLVIFIPSIVCALVLASLYRREEPCSASQELAEFEAQPDGFSVFMQHDNIPLESASRNGAKRF